MAESVAKPNGVGVYEGTHHLEGSGPGQDVQVLYRGSLVYAGQVSGNLLNLVTCHVNANLSNLSPSTTMVSAAPHQSFSLPILSYFCYCLEQNAEAFIQMVIGRPGHRRGSFADQATAFEDRFPCSELPFHSGTDIAGNSTLPSELTLSLLECC